MGWTGTMIKSYVRVSTDRQTSENQRFEVLKFAAVERLQIDGWVEEMSQAGLVAR